MENTIDVSKLVSLIIKLVGINIHSNDCYLYKHVLMIIFYRDQDKSKQIQIYL